MSIYSNPEIHFITPHNFIQSVSVTHTHIIQPKQQQLESLKQFKEPYVDPHLLLLLVNNISDSILLCRFCQKPELITNTVSELNSEAHSAV